MSAQSTCHTCQTHTATLMEALANYRAEQDAAFKAKLNDLPRAFFDCDKCGRHLESEVPGGSITCPCGRSFNAYGMTEEDREADPETYELAEALAARARMV